MADADPHAEVRELRRWLEEAESTLAAIRNGEVDALVIGGGEVYTLHGADHPYRVLVEAMQQGAVTLSPHGIVVYCNASFARMLGRAAEKTIGVAIETLFRPTDQFVLQQRLAAGNAAKPAELLLRPDDGNELPVLVTFNLLPLDDMQAMCLVITDLTEHKQNQQLQDTDRRKDEFLGMLAHELRNPLAPIANAAQVLCLSSNGANEEVQWACDVVIRQVRQMSRIVDDLLDISRITRRKINLQKAKVEVSTVLKAAVETSSPLIESRRQKLHIVLAEEPLLIDADITRLGQVVTNLLNNAAKFTPEGGEIWLALERQGSQAVITVRDNGMGMPPEMLPTIFDLFMQAVGSIDRSQGGLGIGLTLVRSLVEMHRGTVQVSSDGLGKGTRFDVRLPLVRGFRQSHDGQVTDKPSQFALASSIVRRRILVVDDNVDAATMLAMMLNALGHESIAAHDGPTALNMAESFRQELVLLDIGLPGMNGYMVAEQMRQMPALHDAILAALTGYGEDQDRRRAKESGFDEHFVKPISLDALQQLIDALPVNRA